MGYALQQTCPDHISLVALRRNQLDLSVTEQIAPVLASLEPDAVINAAAYTAVDKAESEQELALSINATAVGEIARYCQKQNIPLLQVSTDFVFDGESPRQYQTDDPASPLGVYGASKLQGEALAQEHCEKSWIVRTGWVYGEHGNNFVKTMLRLSRERKELGVVADQVGTPTYARHLAEMLWLLLAQQPQRRVYHFSDAGVASWYDFALAAFDEAQKLSLIDSIPSVKPLKTEAYPTPAARPPFSVLDKTWAWSELDITPVHWRVSLIEMLTRLKTITKP